jgi:hypothetical protein
VPVLMGGTGMPPASYWPRDLVVVTRRNAFPIRADHWDADITQLVEALERKPSNHAQSYSLRGEYEDYIRSKNTYFDAFKKRFGKPSMAVSEIARVLAQWFRMKGYWAQTLYRVNDIVVQCCDRIKWRSAVGAPLVLSIIMTSDTDSLIVNFQPGRWVDQSVPEGVAHKGQIEVPDEYRRMAIYLVPVGAAYLIPALHPVAWPVIVASFWACIQVGKKRKSLASEADQFLHDVLGKSEHL